MGIAELSGDRVCRRANSSMVRPSSARVPGDVTPRTVSHHGAPPRNSFRRRNRRVPRARFTAARAHPGVHDVRKGAGLRIGRYDARVTRLSQDPGQELTERGASGSIVRHLGCDVFVDYRLNRGHPAGSRGVSGAGVVLPSDYGVLPVGVVQAVHQDDAWEKVSLRDIPQRRHISQLVGCCSRLPGAAWLRRERRAARRADRGSARTPDTAVARTRLVTGRPRSTRSTVPPPG